MSDLSTLASRALERASEKGLTIVTAESCTAGKLAALLSEAPGAAERLHGSFVAYTKANKTRALGVLESLLGEKGAVCPEVAVSMAQGALARSPADIALPSPALPVPNPTRTAIRSDGSASSSRVHERAVRMNTITEIPDARPCRPAPCAMRWFY
jgi:predicted component of type VI protein secretion system